MFSNTLFAAINVSTQATSAEMMSLAGFLATITAFFAAMALIGWIVGVLMYVYFSLTLQTIAKKLGYKNPWLAWVPFANIAMLLQLGNFHWALVFLLLIPILGMLAISVLLIIAMWRIFVKRKYPGWLILIPIGLVLIPVIGWVLIPVAHAIIQGIVAWKDR